MLKLNFTFLRCFKSKKTGSSILSSSFASLSKQKPPRKAPEIAGLGGSDALLLQKASDSTVVEGVVDKTIANLRGNLAEAAQAAKAAKAADAEIEAKAAKAAAAAAKPPTPSEPVVDTSAPATPPAPAAAKPATPPAPVVDISPPATPPAPESPNRMTKEEWQHERDAWNYNEVKDVLFFIASFLGSMISMSWDCSFWHFLFNLFPFVSNLLKQIFHHFAKYQTTYKRVGGAWQGA